MQGKINPPAECRLRQLWLAEIKNVAADLDWGQLGGQAQASIIAMGHYDATDHARAQAPTGLVHMLQLPLLVKEARAEGPGEVGAQIVRGARLQRCRLSLLMPWVASSSIVATVTHAWMYCRGHRKPCGLNDFDQMSQPDFPGK